MADLYTYEGFNLYAQNVNKSLQLKTLKTGNLKEKEEDFRPGFSNMGIKLGMGIEPITFEFMTVGDDIETLQLFGYGAGTVQNFTAYKASKGRFEDNTVNQTIINVRGRIIGADEDENEAGKLIGTKYHVGEIQRYRHIRNGVLVFDFDLARGGNVLTRGAINTALGM